MNRTLHVIRNGLLIALCSFLGGELSAQAPTVEQLEEGNIIFDFSLSPDRDTIAYTVGEEVVLAKMEGNEELLRLTQAHSMAIISTDFHPRGGMVASAGRDGKVILWNLDKASPQWVREQVGVITSVKFSPEGKWLATGGTDKVVRIWEVSSGKLVHELEGHEMDVTCLAFSPHHNVLISGSADRTLRIWNIETGRFIALMNGHQDWVRDIATLPDTTSIATCGDDGRVIIWSLQNISSPQFIKAIPTGISRIYTVEFIEYPNKMIYGGQNGKFEMYYDLGIYKGKSSSSIYRIAYLPPKQEGESFFHFLLATNGEGILRIPSNSNSIKTKQHKIKLLGD